MPKMWLATGLLLLAAGPFDVPLRPTDTAPTARGVARLVYAPSPFGVAVTVGGVASHDVRFELSGLPAPSSLGAYTTYVAWAATTNLSRWYRLGPVSNGTVTVGRVELNKFLLVISVEADSLVERKTGPTILHGPSPSAWLQSMLSHPLFRGIPPG